MTDQPDAGAERRAFLKKAGKFAVTVPPAMTVLFSTVLQSTAIAQSNGALLTHNSAPTTTYSDGPATNTTTTRTGVRTSKQ